MFLSESFRANMQKLGLKTPIFKNLGARLKLWAPVITSVENLQLPPACSFIQNTAA